MFDLHLNNGIVINNVNETDNLEELAKTFNAELSDVQQGVLGFKKASFRKKINKERDERINAGVEFPLDSGEWYDSDETAQKNINGAVTMYSLAVQSGQSADYKQPWIKLDGTVTVLDGAAVTGLGIALGKHVGKHRIQAAEYKQQLDAADSIDTAQTVLATYIATANES